MNDRDEYLGELEMEPPPPRRVGGISRVPYGPNHPLMRESDRLDEYVCIDSNVGPGAVAKFEYVAELPFRVERLFFDEPVRNVLVKLGIKRNGKVTMTRHLPLSWFAGVGKDGRNGQPVTLYKPLDLGSSFIIEFDNASAYPVRIIGVLGGTLVGHKL